MSCSSTHTLGPAATELLPPAEWRARIEQKIAAAPPQSVAWVLYVDLDRFRRVNMLFGYELGDSMLDTIGNRISASIGTEDAVTRLAGDEYAVLFVEQEGRSLDDAFLARLMRVVAAQLEIGSRSVQLSCCIGIALVAPDAEDCASLLKQASMAMYFAKDLGPNQYQFYSPAMNMRALERDRISSDLPGALARGEFCVRYFPEIDLRNGCVVCMHAEAAWQHPTLGLLGGERFLSQVDDLDLTGMLSEWMWRASLRQVREWNEAGARVHLNLSLTQSQLRLADMTQRLYAALDACGCHSSDLEVELCADAVAAFMLRTSEVLAQLKRGGVRVALRCAGIGTSILQELRHLPLDTLRIERRCMPDIQSDPDSAAVITAIARLARSRGLELAANCNDQPALVQHLRRLGCARAQGMYFPQPMSAADCSALIRNGWRADLLTEPQTDPSGGVLILDDEIMVASSLRRVLREQGYPIITAHDGETAFAALASHNIHVVVCDQCMPGMSGVEFLGRMHMHYDGIVPIMLTGQANVATLTDAINDGQVFRFLNKPWDDAELRGAVRAAFERHRSTRRTVKSAI